MSAKNIGLVIAISSLFLILFTTTTGIYSLTDSQDYVSVDSESYLSSAKMLYEGGKVHSKRPLTYAAVLASGLAMGISQAELIWYAYALNIFFWISTALLLYRTLNLYLKNQFSILGLILFALCIGNLANLNSALSESLTTMLFMLAGYVVCANELKGRLLTGLTYAVGILFFTATIRPGVWYLALISLLVLVIFVLVKKRRPSSKALTFLSATLLILLLNMAFFKAQYGTAAISLIDKYTWYPYIGAQVEAEVTGSELGDVKSARHAFLKQAGPTEELIEEVRSDMKSGLADNITVVIQMAFRNIRENLSAQSSPFTTLIQLEGASTWRVVLLKGSGYQNILLSLGGLIAALTLFFRTKRFSVFAILAVIVYTIGTSGVSFWQGDRFHLVFYPLSILMILLLYSEFRKSALRTA